MKFEEKFLVIKREDIDLALDGIQRKTFWDLVDRVNIMRTNQGKESNNYFVVNFDEPYAHAVAKLLYNAGHSYTGEDEEAGKPSIEFEEDIEYGDTSFNVTFEDEMHKALQDAMEMDFTELPSFCDGSVVGDPNESREEFIGRCLKRKMKDEEGE